ncbi:RNA polymerase sigma factor [Lacticaseibacillus suihuaensis]
MGNTQQTVAWLAEQHGASLYHFCQHLTHSADAAGDLYQETFLRLLTMTTPVDLTRNPQGFLMAVAVRLWQDSRRKFARRRRIAPAAPDEALATVAGGQNPVAISEQHAAATLVRTLVAQLPEPLRVPVLLFYMGELSVGEIAECLDIPVGTVKSRLHQARRKLQTGLERCHYER